MQKGPAKTHEKEEAPSSPNEKSNRTPSRRISEEIGVVVLARGAPVIRKIIHVGAVDTERSAVARRRGALLEPRVGENGKRKSPASALRVLDDPVGIYTFEGGAVVQREGGVVGLAYIFNVAVPPVSLLATARMKNIMREPPLTSSRMSHLVQTQ